MTRIVIEKRSKLIYGFLIFFVAALVFFAASLLLVEIDIRMLFHLPLISIVLSLYIYPAARYKKEMIILDHDGLTLNVDIMLGPIPWDCISGAKVYRVMLEKKLNVYVADMPKLKSVFGEDVRKKVNVKKKTGEMFFIVDLDICRLRGIDLEAQINQRAKGGGRYDGR